MIENYRREIPSPFMKKRPYDIQGPDHPVRDEIKKFVGKYNIVAEIEEDTATIALLDYVPGLVSFLCTLRDSDGKILSQGRGSAVLNQNNRYISKMLNLAFGSAFVDASVRCAKVLDTLRTNGQDTPDIASNDHYETRENTVRELASDKQKKFLRGLIRSGVKNENSRQQMESEIDDMTKKEASEKINFLMASR